MKTTVDLPDALLREAKALADREGTTLRALIERGLRQMVKAKGRSRRFRLKDASFKGRGLKSPFREDRWEEIREAAYEGRGG